MTPPEMKRVPGTLIVAGIGATDLFEALLQTLSGLPERLVVVEPAETPGGRLAQRFAGLDGVTLIDGVLGDEPGAVELVPYNLPGLRSTKAPTDALHTLFPGLKPRTPLSTRAIALAQALDDVDAFPAPVRLRIDMPGAEVAILQAMEDIDALDRVDLLSLRCSDDVMFAGGVERNGLQSWLEARYFRLDHVEEDDPDWPELLLKADPARKRIAELESALSEANAARAAVQAEVETLRAELTGSTAKAEALNAQLTEREKALTDSQSAVEKHGKRASELEGKLSEAKAARAALETTLAEARNAAASEAATLRASLEAAQAKAEKQASLIREKDTAHALSHRDRDKAFSDLGLAMRMQGLMQSDLDDLRARYQQSEQTRATQEALLRKLTPRLQEAAQQLRQLQLATEPGEVLKVTTPKVRKPARAATRSKGKSKSKHANDT